MSSCIAHPEVGQPPPSSRPPHELADILRLYGAEYRLTHRLPLHHLKVMSAIERCRTAALGGHVEECDSCGHQRLSYNSCRDRHCPKCQAQARRRWVEAQQAALLPIEYFHAVMTMPAEINPLLRFNQKLMLNLLFKAASETLLEFGARHLKGELGITAVLHTWGQTLVEHPHLHCIVTGGALSPDGQRFVRAKAGYLFPVKALSQVFRAKYCEYLHRAYKRAELVGAVAMLETEESFAGYVRELRAKAWVVYAKRPFAGPEQVIGYLGRYTHRAAITNNRIISIEDAQVSFSWKDYRSDGERKVMVLGAAEFIRRFLLHVLPAEFVRIRHYGLLANGRRRTKLLRCRELLGVAPQQSAVAAESDGDGKAEEGAEGEGVRRCEVCGAGRMVRRGEWPPGCGPPSSSHLRCVA